MPDTAQARADAMRSDMASHFPLLTTTRAAVYALPFVVAARANEASFANSRLESLAARVQADAVLGTVTKEETALVLEHRADPSLRSRAFWTDEQMKIRAGV